MLQNKYDVVVVGGGPAGSMAAWEAAKKGVSVCMLEKDRDIGYPVRKLLENLDSGNLLKLKITGSLKKLPVQSWCRLISRLLMLILHQKLGSY